MIFTVNRFYILDFQYIFFISVHEYFIFAVFLTLYCNNFPLVILNAGIVTMNMFCRSVM